jgi:uncharacterized protein (DUF1800 family)
MRLWQRDLREAFGLRVMATALLAVQTGFPAALVAQQAAAPAPVPAAPASSAGADAQGDATPGMMDGSLPNEPVMLREHPTSSAVLPDDVRYLLILERFTYGPRPGDLDKLRHMGLQTWFEQQMNPAKIDDHVLDAKLASYPAMQMPLSRLMELYPTNEQIRQAVNRGVGIPGGDAARAIYADQEAQYKAKRSAKAGQERPNEQTDLPESADEILALPPDKRFKELCRLTLPQLRTLRRGLTPDQRTQLTDGMTPQQVEAIAAFNNPSAVVQAEDVQVKLLRDVYTERQLQEVMVDFWLNHFNVYIKKSQQAPYYIAAYERAAIRPYALGRFENLLLATATSPAMLNYLDNSSSVGPHSDYANGGPLSFGTGLGFRSPPPRVKRKDVGLNENYAREVMELHTIGVNGGYTQKDVTELAKIFTGWTVGKANGMDVPSVAQYDPSKHEPGTKTVLGNKVKENGQMEGVEVLKALAASPQCAHFISTKLAVRFVSDTPPPAMVKRMEQTYLETHGDIRQVLLAMVNSPEFFTAATYRAKLKTPQDFVVSAVRATGADVDSTAGMQAAIAELGMPVYGMLTPNGYSMTADAWNNTSQLVSRMNFSMALATNRVPGIQADPVALLGHDVESTHLTPEQKTARLEAILLHGAVSAKTQNLILGQLRGDAEQQQAELRQVAGVRNANDPLHPAEPRKSAAGTADPQAALAEGLILGSPEFQRR